MTPDPAPPPAGAGRHGADEPAPWQSSLYRRRWTEWMTRGAPSQNSLLSMALAAFSALLLLCACGVFFFCRMIYTDHYYSQRQMYETGEPDTWQDTLDYAAGLAVFSLPAIVLAGVALIMAVLAVRIGRAKARATTWRRED